MEEEIEVLDEDFMIPTNNVANNVNVNTNNTSAPVQNNDNNFDNVISLDRLFDRTNEEEVIDAYEDDLIKSEIKQKKITRIQIGLIVFLVVFASLVYFFGYDFVEPYIKADGYNVFNN